MVESSVVAASSVMEPLFLIGALFATESLFVAGCWLGASPLFVPASAFAIDCLARIDWRLVAGLAFVPGCSFANGCSQAAGNQAESGRKKELNIGQQLGRLFAHASRHLK